jgi:hypothetical protein
VSALLLVVASTALGALAQEAPVMAGDDTGRTIMLVIAALLALALLLAVLTFWYWRRTDPRRAAPARPAPVARATGADPGPRQAASRRGAPAGRSGGTATGPGGEGTAADRGISPEEWRRLTGARQSPRRDPS